MSEWNEFARSSPRGCIYQDFGWKEVFESVFGHRCHYLASRAGGRMAGLLPLVEMNSRWFGHRLVSLPFVTYGGLLAGSPEAEQELLAEAVALAGRTGARSVELRQRFAAGVPWSCRRHKVALIVRLAAGPETLWAGLSSRLRGKVRKARREGAEFAVRDGGGVAEFYPVFARNMRDLGTPVYPRAWFEAIARRFPEAACVFLVRQHGAPAAAAFGLRDGAELRLPWICSDYAHAASYGNELLYWSVLEWAAGHGFEAVDLGRSTAGGGNHRFKLQWNPDQEPLPWYGWLAEGEQAPQLSPESPRFALAVRCWRRLPLWAANAAGPRIVRHLP